MTTNGNGNGAHPPEPGDDPLGAPLERWVPGPGWRRREGAPASFGAFAEARRAERRRRRRRLRLVLGSTGLGLLLVAWAMAFSSSSGVGSVEPTIGDEAFVDAAREICGPVRDRLADAADARQGEDPDDDERAEALDGVVAELDEMVEGLRELEPDPEDVPEVEAWLEDWEAVLAAGRRTADALGDGDRDAADAATRDLQEPGRAVNAFAGANGIPDCGAAPG